MKTTIQPHKNKTDFHSQDESIDKITSGYEKPTAELIEMETQGSILTSSIPDMPGDDW